MKHFSFAKVKQRFSMGIMAALFVSIQLAVAAVPFLPAATVNAATPAEVCAVEMQLDTAGPDDEPGQKDLTQMCQDLANAGSGSIQITWNWDDTDWSGNNTGDGCALFDTNNNGLADYSLCAVVKGSPAQITDTRVYSCDDEKPDRCTNPTEDKTITSSCTTTTGVDPFNGGTDTTAFCTVQLADVGGLATTKLLDVCSYPSQRPNSDPSDCIVFQTKSGTIEVQKVLVPAIVDDRFDLLIDGVVKADEVGHTGTTGPQTVSVATHTVSEVAGTTGGTVLGDYTSSIACYKNGSNTPFVSANATTIDVAVADSDVVVCIITNTLKDGGLTIIKDVINDNGGTKTYADFSFTVNGTPYTFQAAQDGEDGSRTVNLPVGTNYTVSEVNPNTGGYTLDGYSTGCTGTIVADQTQICTITNNDNTPSLTLNKVVSGGTSPESAWTLTATGPTTISGPGAAGDTDVVSGTTFHAGTYTLSESGDQTGYTASTWACTNGVTVTDSKITLTNGQTTVCTITNTRDTGTLRILKQIDTNGDGTYDGFSSDWSWSATGPVVQDGTTGDNASIVPTGNYSLAESGGLANYHFDRLECTGGTLTGMTVSVTKNTNVVCTFYNQHDTGIIDFLKIVSGGGPATEGDWLFNISNGDTAASGESVKIATGTYTVTEDGEFMSLYNLTGATGSCSLDENNIITLVVALTNETCSITNTRKTGSIQVVKEVINDNSGQSIATDFHFQIDGGSNHNFALLPNGEDGNATVSGLPTAIEYVITEPEANTNGYTTTYNNCQITVVEGQTQICTITNDDIEHPEITVVKYGPATAHEGDMVTYTFKVTNTGDTPTLSNVTVTDTIGDEITQVTSFDGDTNEDGLLQKSETWTFTLDYIIPTDTESVFNTANACGYSPGGTQDCDDSTHELVVLHPEIQVIKTANVTEANPGDPVTYTFTIKNTGDTPVSVTKVDDSITDDGEYQSGDTNANDLLDLTETWIYTVDYAIPANQVGPVINTVEVCAIDSLQGEDCDEDTHTLLVLAKIIVTKYNDIDRSGTFTDGDELLPDWVFNLNCPINEFLEQALVEDSCVSMSQTTGQDGTATFNNVRPGTAYTLAEQIPEDGNWNAGDVVCGNGTGTVAGSYTFSTEEIGQGQTITCSVGNYRDAALELTKTNDTPNAVNVGATVTYTLVVTVPEDSGAVFGTTVTDLPPEGFTYVPGSWTASSNMGPIEVSEPTYASPGVWILGNLLPGQVVTLTYKALIGANVSNGTYPDLAFARGCEVDCEIEGAATVFGNVSTGSNTPFVGTNVTITRPEVLAANITRYVDTGASNVWMNTLAAMTLAGAALITLVRREQKGAK